MANEPEPTEDFNRQLDDLATRQSAKAATMAASRPPNEAAERQQKKVRQR